MSQILRTLANTPSRDNFSRVAREALIDLYEQLASPDLVTDGVTDESVALKTAHDAARDAGLRYLFIEGPVYAPTAINLGDVIFLTRTGKGRLIGTYRKRVVPASAATLLPLVTVTPSTHLARWNAAVAAATTTDPAVLVFMSDSWGQPNQLIGRQSQFEEQLWRALQAQYGEKARDGSIVVVNRALGSQKWNNAASLPTGLANYPTWYADEETPWLDYVTAVDLTEYGYAATVALPHLVILMFGMNHDTVPTATDLTDINTVVTTIEAVSPRPDIAIVAGPTPSTQSATRGSKTAQEARRSFAGLARAIAATRDYGLLDFARQYDGAFWGADPVLTYVTRAAASNLSVNLGTGYTWPGETTDFALDITATGLTDATFWATGDGSLTIPLSPTTGNALILDRDGGTGRIAYTINSATGVAFVSRTVSDAATVGGSGGTLWFSVRGPDLYVSWRNQIIYRGPVMRSGGLHTPLVKFGGSGSVTVTANTIASAVEPFALPYLNDDEMWGETTGAAGDIGGNDENHLSEVGRADIFSRVLLATRWL